MKAHELWGEGKLDEFMDCLADDIVYNVNVEGIGYAASANGKSEVRARLQLLLDTFVVQAFVVEEIVHEADFTRTRVLGYYKHKRTGERLDIAPRFRGYVREGLLVRIDEVQDAAYIQAFERFVRFIEHEAELQRAASAASAARDSSEASP